MRKLVLLCCASVLSLLLPNASCEAFSEFIEGRGVIKMPGQTTWNNALNTCRGRGLELPMIENFQQDQQLKDLMRQYGMYAVWLGATDDDVEGRWIWVETGVPVSFTNWTTFRAYNWLSGWYNVKTPAGDGDCLEWTFDGQEGWNDVTCNKKRSFFCMETKRNAMKRKEDERLEELQMEIKRLNKKLEDIQESARRVYGESG